VMQVAIHRSWTRTCVWRGSYRASRLRRANSPSQTGCATQIYISIQERPERRLTSISCVSHNAVVPSILITGTAPTASSNEGTAASGLYGVPGLRTPDNLIELAAQIVVHCQELQVCLDLLEDGLGGDFGLLHGASRYRHLTRNGSTSEAQRAADAEAVRGAEPSGAEDAASELIRRHHEAVSWLRPLAEHCAAHHVDRGWREAAGRAAQALQAVEDLLACRLASHRRCSQRLTWDPSHPSAYGVTTSGDVEPTVSRAHGEDVKGIAAIRATGNDTIANRTEAVEKQVHSNVGEAGSDSDRLRLVSEAVSRVAALSEEDRQEYRELEQLEQQLLAAFRAALFDPGVNPVPLVVLHDSEVEGDPLLERHVTPATEAEVAEARAGRSIKIPLVFPPSAEQGDDSTGGHATGDEGAEAVLENGSTGAEVELGPVAAATRRAARTRDGRLWSLRLTGPLTSLLLTEHLSIDVRRAVHAVTYGSQASATLSFMNVLRPLRDRLAACLHQPSYAHLKLAGSVAADPRVALSLLSDILSAVRPLADEEVATMQRLLMEQLLGEQQYYEEEEGEEEGGPAGVEDPLNLRGSIDFFRAHRDPPLSGGEWRELAPYFTIDGLIKGLSRQLSYMLGIELRASKPHPCELWNPENIVRLELRETGGSSNSYNVSSSRNYSSGNSKGRTSGRGPEELVGVLYIYFDSDCDMPYTVLVRHGFEGYDGGSSAPWLQRRDDDEPNTSNMEMTSVTQQHAQQQQHLEERHNKGQDPQRALFAGQSMACTPHVALHLPAGQVTSGSGGYLVPEHPGLIRTLAHELGHALHYIMSYSPGSLPDDNACYSSTDFLELVSHILERWVADPWVLSSLSCHALSGAKLPPRRCAAVAAVATRQTTWLEVQQHTLAAAADLLMHLNGSVDLQQLQLLGESHPLLPPSPPLPEPSLPPVASSTAAGTAVPASATVLPAALYNLQSTCTSELVSALWAVHSSLPSGAFQSTRGLMALLPGFLHNGASMYAYPAAQLVAAALWELHFAQTAAPAGSPLESPAAVRFGRLLRQGLLQAGDCRNAAALLEALLGPGCVRRVRLGQKAEEKEQLEERALSSGVGGQLEGIGASDGGCYGVIPDLAHKAFQGIDLLMF
ncbi:hypothetical protein Vretimale_1613, partial [Volvox reticuliferus]